MREKQKEEFVVELDQKMCEVQTVIYEMDWQSCFLGGVFYRDQQGKAKLEEEKRRLEQEKRQHEVECWRDKALLQKELRQLRKEYRAVRVGASCLQRS